MSWLSGKSAEPTMMLSVDPAAWELLLVELMGSPPQALRAMAVAAARAKPVRYFFMSILSGRAVAGHAVAKWGWFERCCRRRAGRPTAMKRGSCLDRDGGFHGVSRRGRGGRLDGAPGQSG